MLSHGIRTKVSTEPFFHPNGKKFESGAILVSLDNQDKNPDQIEVYIREIAERDGIDVHGFNTGLDYRGVSLGSSSFQVLKKPEIAMLVEGGVSSLDAGEMWHLFDQRYNIPVTLMPLSVFNTASINRYNTLILPPGTYSIISESAKEKLKAWTQNGGLIIGFENALSWLQTAGLGKFDLKKEEDLSVVQVVKKDATVSKPYSDIDENRGAEQTSGALFETTVDLTNPLLYGYYDSKVPLFKSNNIFMEKAKGAYANPMIYGNAPLLSGYIRKPNYEKLKNTSALGVSVVGKGKVIGFTEGVTFRAFCYGTNKLLMNAIFYGPFISSEAGR